mgnify:FL=1
MEDFKKFIRDIPDFPSKGIVFKDITPLLSNGKKFKELIDVFYERYKDKKLDKIVGIEARGFIFGSALAVKLGVGFVPVRKKGKLPYKTVSCSYELEYGQDTLEMHQDAINPNDRVVLIDDLLATGGTASAVAGMITKFSGKIIEIAFFINLTFLNGKDKLKNYQVYSVLDL